MPVETKTERYAVSIKGTLTFTVDRDVDGNVYVRFGVFSTGTNAVSDEFTVERETDDLFPNNYVIEEDLDVLDEIWMILPSEGDLGV